MGRLEVGIDRGSLLQFYETLWGPIYEAVFSILGSTGVVVPLGDPKQGQPSATTFSSMGEEQVTFTWSEAPSGFDSKLDLTGPDSFQGIVPIAALNGADERCTSPDAAYWTRGDGSSDSAFSCGVWFKAAGVTGTQTIFAKDESSSAREWYLQLSGTTFRMRITDDSAVAAPRVDKTGAEALRWYFLVFTYDGTGGASAMNGADLYVDGVGGATRVNDGSYVAMEDLTATPSIGAHSSGSNWFDGELAGGPAGPFFVQKELTADEVLRLYDLGRRAMGL